MERIALNAYKKAVDLRVKKVFALCLSINEKGVYYAFCNFSGHVNKVHIMLTKAPDYQEFVLELDVKTEPHFENGWPTLIREWGAAITALKQYV